MLARLGNTLYRIGFIGAALFAIFVGGVEVQHDFMIIRVTGTSFTVSYCKALDSSLGTFPRRAIITLP
jgi:hypothetical protein